MLFLGIFLVERFPVTQESSQIGDFLLKFFYHKRFFLNWPRVDLLLNSCLFFLCIFDGFHLVFVIISYFLNLTIYSFNLIYNNGFFLLKFFIFQMKRMYRVIHLNNKLLQKLDFFHLFDLNLLLQVWKLFCALVQFFPGLLKPILKLLGNHLKSFLFVLLEGHLCDELWWVL